MPCRELSWPKLNMESRTSSGPERRKVCMGAPGMFVTRQPGAEFHSKDDTQIAFAARDALAVKMLEQRDCVLARDARNVLELRDVDRGLAGPRLVIGEHRPQRGERVFVEDEVVTEFDECAIAEK